MLVTETPIEDSKHFGGGVDLPLSIEFKIELF